MAEETKIVKESPMRTVCGIELPVTDKMTDEEIEDFVKEIEPLTRIELLKLKKEFNDARIQGIDLESMFKDAKLTYESFLEIQESFSTPDVVQNTIDEIKAELEEEDLDFDKIEEEITSFKMRSLIGSMIVGHRLKELAEISPPDLKADIIETLIKNKDTLNQSGNLNKELLTSYIDRVVNEIKETADGFLDPRDRMLNKLQNPKRVDEIIKFVRDNPERARIERHAEGLNDDIVAVFLGFMYTEQLYHADVDPNDDDSLTPVEKAIYELDPINFLEEMKAGYSLLCETFAYHIAKIVKSEVKRQNYLSLIFKCYILQIVELETKCKDRKDIFGVTVQSRRNRAGLNKDSDGYRLSEIRRKLFGYYNEVFVQYIGKSFIKV